MIGIAAFNTVYFLFVWKQKPYIYQKLNYRLVISEFCFAAGSILYISFLVFDDKFTVDTYIGCGWLVTFLWLFSITFSVSCIFGNPIEIEEDYTYTKTVSAEQIQK